MSAPATASSPTSSPAPDAASSPTSSPPPPGAPAGGQWGKNKYIGQTTGVAAFIGCLCFCVPGLLILCCPFDERDAYMVNGKVYDASGKLLGSAGQIKFVPARS